MQEFLHTALSSMQELLHIVLQYAGIATYSPRARRNCYEQPTSMQELLHTALEHAGKATYTAPQHVGIATYAASSM